MENKEKIEKLKAIENEVRGILQGGNRRIKPELLGSYRTLLHKTRIERLTLQIETLAIKSGSGNKPANVLVKMKKDGEVELTPCGHGGDIKIKPGLFDPNRKKGDPLKKNIDELQKGLVQTKKRQRR